MKRVILTLVIVLIINKKFSAQSVDPIPNWYNYTCGNSPNGCHTFGDAIAIDNMDNVIYGGYASGVAYRVLDSVVFIGNHNFFITKFSKNDSIIFTKTFGGPGNFDVSITRIKTDDFNNIYLCGYLNYNFLDSVIYFDQFAIESDGGQEKAGFMAKLNSEGSVLWVRKTNTTDIYGNSPFNDFEIFNGGIYICGHLKSLSNVTIGNVFIQNNSTGDIGFIAKYDVNGNFIHAEAISTNAVTRPWSLDVDDAGNLVVVGYFSGQLVVDGITVSSVENHTNSFILKYDGSFNASWIKQGSTDGGGLFSGFEELNVVRIDAIGNIYAIGSGYGTVTSFSNLSFNHASGIASNDIYMVKFNSSGELQWLKHGGSDKNDIARSLSLDPGGNPVVGVKTGLNTTMPCYFENDQINTPNGSGFVKYNPSGSLIYARYFSEATSIIDMVHNSISSMYICGNFPGHFLDQETQVNIDCQCLGCSSTSNSAKSYIFKLEDNYPCNSSYSIWTGGIGDWSNSSNWCQNQLPGILDNVIINKGQVIIPQGSQITINSIKVDKTSSITISQNSYLDILD